jgi:hypothetical protein
MKYIIVCIISIGIASAGLAQDYSNCNVSVSGNKSNANYKHQFDSGLYNKQEEHNVTVSGNKSDANYKHQFNAGLYNKQQGKEYSSLDALRNDRLMPDQSLIERVDEVYVRAEEKPDLKDESSFVDLNEHLTMGEPQTLESSLLKEQRQTEFEKTCSVKRQEGGFFSQPFKIKGDNLKAERKASGEERMKFHNKNENLVYHEKKNGKSHYKYSFNDHNTDLKVQKKKNGEGSVILKSENIEKDQSAWLMEQGISGVAEDIHFCLR